MQICPLDSTSSSTIDFWDAKSGCLANTSRIFAAFIPVTSISPAGQVSCLLEYHLARSSSAPAHST